MRLEFARSSGRHRIDHERVRHVIAHCPMPLYSDDDPESAVILLGADQFGVDLEVAAIELADGSLRVIHAMRMRRAYRAMYAEVMRWHER